MTGWDVGAIEARVKLATEDMRRAAVKGLEDAAEHVLGVSNQRVPIEEATLERSGRASVDASTLQAAVSYDTPYAVVQHEDMTLQHDPGRSAKFLETALNQEAGAVQQIIADRIRRETR